MPHHESNSTSSSSSLKAVVQHGVPLPNEILADIFLWLLHDPDPSTSIREIHNTLLSCMLTCREWQSMVWHYLEWIRPSIGNNGVASSMLAKRLPWRWIRDVALDRRVDVDVGAAVLARCSGLTRLQLSWYLGGDDVAVLRKAIRLDADPGADAGAGVGVGMGRNRLAGNDGFAPLRELVLRRCYFMCCPMEVLAMFVRACGRTLERISLEVCEINFQFIPTIFTKPLLAGGEPLVGVREITVTETMSFTDSFLTSFCLPRVFPHLETLCLDHCKTLTDWSLTQLIQVSPRLTRVRLLGTQITNITVEALAHHCPHLRELAIGTEDCPYRGYPTGGGYGLIRNITDRAISLLGRNCPRLERVYLNGCASLSDDGLGQLVGGGSSGKRIVELDLGGTQVTPQFFARHEDAFRGCLRVLVLDECPHLDLSPETHQQHHHRQHHRSRRRRHHRRDSCDGGSTSSDDDFGGISGADGRSRDRIDGGDGDGADSTARFYSLSNSSNSNSSAYSASAVAAAVAAISLACPAARPEPRTSQSETSQSLEMSSSSSSSSSSPSSSPSNPSPSSTSPCSRCSPSCPSLSSTGLEAFLVRTASLDRVSLSNVPGIQATCVYGFRRAPAGGGTSRGGSTSRGGTSTSGTLNRHPDRDHHHPYENSLRELFYYADRCELGRPQLQELRRLAVQQMSRTTTTSTSTSTSGGVRCRL